MFAMPVIIEDFSSRAQKSLTFDKGIVIVVFILVSDWKFRPQLPVLRGFSRNVKQDSEANTCAPIPVCTLCKRQEGAIQELPGFRRLEFTV
jgi:hypothetical protein